MGVMKCTDSCPGIKVEALPGAHRRYHARLVLEGYR
ncbi:hypothetical protein EDC02_1367 [Micromonospora sp. Llam0]|nr:hypothetical protein EDC02_1367 [Micromonospora sp. Llam0]